MIQNSVVGLTLAAALLVSTAAYAGPPFPCLTSAQSANGKILVNSSLSFDDPDETHPRHVVGSVYQVYRRFADANWGHRISGPNAYWADPFWKVKFDRDSKLALIACSYVLVPDDGEYLVFVGSNLGEDANALTIYRHRTYNPSFGPLLSQQGELVRKIKLAELLPSSGNPLDNSWTDETPVWFAGGTFTFSPDQKSLGYRGKDGRKVVIFLTTGEIKCSLGHS